METISLKLDENFSKKMDKMMKTHDYSTKTEFIREAIRDKMAVLENDDFEQKLRKHLGFAKVKVGDERHEQVREEVFREYAKKLGVKLD